MKVVRDIIIMGNLKVATLTHIWVDWYGAPWSNQWFARAPGETSACPRGSRRTREITLWNATQAQRDSSMFS